MAHNLIQKVASQKSVVGQTASVERSRHVGFTPDFGRMAATQLNDASGQHRKLDGARYAVAPPVRGFPQWAHSPALGSRYP